MTTVQGWSAGAKWVLKSMDKAYLFMALWKIQGATKVSVVRSGIRVRARQCPEGAAASS
jgi:hypothetical protein